jgi:hypothetical protein
MPTTAWGSLGEDAAGQAKEEADAWPRLSLCYLPVVLRSSAYPAAFSFLIASISGPMTCL